MMNFDLDKAIEILQRTPAVLEALLAELSNEWIESNEGPDTWSPYDIIGHLIHGEKTDWIPRMEIVLSENPDRHFIPYDRFAQFEDSKGKTLLQLLEEFIGLRMKNVQQLKAANLTGEDLSKTGIHPEFGIVTLRQMLATWTAHDLNHIAQIVRVMAVQYKSEAGPWVKYLKILQ